MDDVKSHVYQTLSTLSKKGVKVSSVGTLSS